MLDKLAEKGVGVKVVRMFCQIGPDTKKSLTGSLTLIFAINTCRHVNNCSKRINIKQEHHSTV